MRRRVLALILGLVAATMAHVPAQAEPAPPTPRTLSLSAIPADSLVDTYGVGIHLPFLDTPYRNATAVADALDDLGVRHVRDDLYLGNTRQYAGIRTLAARGVDFDLVTGNTETPGTPQQFVDAIATLPAGSVASIEGRNEWDLFSRGASDWANSLTDWQRQLYAAAKANPATSSIPVLGPALAFRQNYSALGDLTPYADLANSHAYPGGYKPDNVVAQTTAALRRVIAEKPLVTTETGYHNAVNTTNGHLPVPEDVAGVYLPRLLLQHVLAGDRRVYSYELVDEFADAARTNPEANFGLLRRDGSAKPAYSAMRNLLALAEDRGPTFDPTPLSLGVTGFPDDGQYLLTQKRDGSYLLFMWRDASIYDPSSKQRSPVVPSPVTLQLPTSKRVSVYRPSESSVPVTRATGRSVSVALDGSVTAIALDNVADAPTPQGVEAVGGSSNATVRWSLPPGTESHVSGFEVTRQPGGLRVELPATARSYTDNGVAGGASYTYAVRSLTADAVSESVPARAVVIGTRPTRPSVAASRVGARKIAVRWRSSSSGGPITVYEVQAGPKTVRVPGSSLQATLTGLRGKRMRVSVRAQNRLGWSPVGYSGYVGAKKSSRAHRG
jgi:hypothetical protein